MQNFAMDLNRMAFFEGLAEQWDVVGTPPSPAKVAAFLEKVGLESGDRVLDLGTGTGLMIPYIFGWDPATVWAVDLSPKMLAKVREKYGTVYGDRLRLLQADVHQLPLEDGSLDKAICNGTFPHFHDKALALAQLHRVLSPGGTLAIHHFIGRNRLNAIHAQSANEWIRQDQLEPVTKLAALAGAAGFAVQMSIDSETEYGLIAVKP
ncbi:demethylmenaquinone methyltransferase/2-methoxy-6-polyprenyl-1,4-benzoquinol methylase [Hydrogenispora ethanolica]|uniref:Demethylmenaquinone methyltransferase/2-methoxy-6-polyprenyl-1,4-benzoquinol methylase n=1 Tax=Hydrogenispora ethanolica TaxID=1082276 RepID=A0A4R1RQA7_HYDET|nr:class I SAM-dependent methyltransferase [Hydrogenispora ethanolica]TCL68583.1 demethylmenaquinone methyltransferase/2-methoxy-6-polyprenyl-1,4-benzoquinol methylase [Hydrogenispora ethanolica]